MLKCLFAVTVAGSLTAVATAGPVFDSANYTSTLTLQSASSTYVPSAAVFSNGFYYTGYGNGINSPFVKLDAAGNLLLSVRPAPGMDFVSLFTNATGDVFARNYNSNAIWKEGVTFGTFKAIQTLQVPINSGGQVLLDSGGTQYIGNDNGTLQFWNLSGVKTKRVILEAGASAGSLSIFGDYAISYNAHGLNAYDLGTGALVDTALLSGLSLGPYALNYGQSYANGYFFIPAPDGSFKGYRIGLPPSAITEPATWALLLSGFGTVGVAMRRRRMAVTA